MNCSFNIRYKPRTTRAFTKSDLTVYDSAGNTALNALTVYGKSEVVDGSIKSAGEGWSTVDLGTLTWSYSDTRIAFNTPLSDIANGETGKIKIICSKYQTTATVASASDVSNIPNMSICQQKDNKQIFIKNTAYTDPTAFQTAMSGVLLCYQLADPTQGNTIAIKTDNGSGIDGTMAVFETGTPLRGIPDTDVRDVMQWDGIAGTVTKNCNKVRLADLMWTAYSTIYYAPISDKINNQNNTGICSSYNIINSNPTSAEEAIAFLTDNNSLALSKDTSTPYAYIRADNYSTLSDFVASLGDAELVYELATPTTTPLTQAENDSITGLRTFEPQTHAQNNAQTDMTIDYTIKVPTI